MKKLLDYFRPTTITRDEYLLTHSEAFEEWLKEECRKRGIDFPKVYSFLQANSLRLERELHWLNDSAAPASHQPGMDEFDRARFRLAQARRKSNA